MGEKVLHQRKLMYNKSHFRMFRTHAKVSRYFFNYKLIYCEYIHFCIQFYSRRLLSKLYKYFHEVEQIFVAIIVYREVWIPIKLSNKSVSQRMILDALYVFKLNRFSLFSPCLLHFVFATFPLFTSFALQSCAIIFCSSQHVCCTYI